MSFKLGARTDIPAPVAAPIPRRPLQQWERNSCDFFARILAEFVYSTEAHVGIEDGFAEEFDALRELLWQVVPKDAEGRSSDVLYLVRFFGLPFDTHETLSCWRWDGPVNQFGYATSPAVFSVHRAIYESFNPGEPLGDLQLHHRCKTKRCINPWHLQPVTEEEHIEIHEREQWEGTKQS